MTLVNWMHAMFHLASKALVRAVQGVSVESLGGADQIIVFLDLCYGSLVHSAIRVLFTSEACSPGPEAVSTISSRPWSMNSLSK